MVEEALVQSGTEEGRLGTRAPGSNRRGSITTQWFPPAGVASFGARLPRFAASSFSGWRRRAEIEVVLLLQSSDDSHHVDKLDLRRPHFRFDSVQLPCPTFRAAVRTNRYGLSVMQRGQLLQLGEQLILDF